VVGVDKTGDREAVFGLQIPNGVAAGDDGAGLIGLVISPAQHRTHRLIIHLRGDTEQIERQFGFASHGIDIAEGIGGGGLSAPGLPARSAAWSPAAAICPKRNGSSTIGGKKSTV